ncbi:MAG TPA: phosphodiester glycosidase family protein, partial [Planctomycetota bacterium]|nr:phosphodiester glycosidase family protein [Planctomycetota bacterium]
GLNPGVRALHQGSWLGVPGPEGGAIAFLDAGRGRAVDPDEPPAGAAFVLTGPCLVRNGLPAVSDATTFADPRHLLLFPYLAPLGGSAFDMGMDRMLTDAAAYQAAVRGELIELPLMMPCHRGMAINAPIVHLPVTPESLDEALKIKGYRTTSDTPHARGFYRICSDRLEIRFLPGIYPHHALVLDRAGFVCSVLVSGKSNRVGVNIAEFAEDLAELGAQQAILLDNGGDVGLYDCQQEAFLIPPAEPDRRGLWPISACLVYGRSPTNTP